jgi:flagellar protein FlaG
MDVSGVTMYDMAASKPVASAPAAAAVTTASVSAPVAQPVDAELAKPAQSPLDAAIEKLDKQNGAISRNDLDKALAKINKSLLSFNREMEVSVHDKLNRIMVKVMDTKENKIIREIPPEKVLDAFAKALELAGVLIDEKR